MFSCKRCDGCGLVFSCTLHLPLHSHNTSCYPWRVQRQDGVGRYLVATRDIKPKELILRDKPFGLSPVQDSEPVCLQCFRLLAEKALFLCECGFPMCNEECSLGERHIIECNIYKSAKVKMATSLEYQLIMPIRMISQLSNEKLTKNRFDTLMDHLQQRILEPKNWKAIQNQVISPIREKLKITEWSEDLIQRCVGVVRTNGSLIQPYSGEGEPSATRPGLGLARGIFLSMATMSHTCIPNCNTLNNPDFSLSVKSMRTIKAGEELTISYCKLFSGRLERKNYCENNWFFTCTCSRCNDRTDLGTNFDTHLCRTCGGSVLPLELENNCPWRCENCSQITEASHILEIEAKLRKRLNQIEESDFIISCYEEFLKECSILLHPGHNIVMQAKCKLLMSYDRTSVRRDLERKCELGEELLTVLETILPGYTDIRGRILYELTAPLFLLLQLDLESGKTSLERFSELLVGLVSRVEECIRCLEGEETGTYGEYLEKKALLVLHNIKEMVEFSKYL